MTADRARHRPAVLLLTALAVASACAAPDQSALQEHGPAITQGAPESVGFSSDGIDRIGPAMQELIDAERTAGIMTLVARQGTVVHWEANGWRVLGEDPLERTDVFRIYSMTKPVTSTAVMMLIEEEVIGLDDPLSLYLPDFGGVQVYDGGALRDATREITIRDLLRHTSGLTYGIFADTPVDRMYQAEFGGVLNPQSGLALEELASGIAELPLLADPGTVWNYSLSTDVLGRVVEVTSGMSLREFFRTRIFEPLDMHETDFHVAPERLDRLTAVYRPGEGGLQLMDSPVDGLFTKEATWYSGGGGLTSTAMDYLRFAQMLLNEGELEGVRILDPESVREMTRDQLPEGHGPIALSPTDGFGLGFAVSTTGDTPGIYWWAGVRNTWFWIDPVEEIVAFAWTQLDPFGGVPVNPIMRELVYEALTEATRAVPVGAP
jgi:CubicO group peptidase (beta-lactamase class C family)